MSMVHLLGIVLVVLITPAMVVAGGEGGAQEVKVRVLDAPDTSSGNAHYVGNRPPLTPSPLIKLPVGAVRPRGWVRGQLVRLAEGMTGRLHELSPWCRFDDNAWSDTAGHGGRGWEEMPYWLKGFVDLGHLLEDRRILEESDRWIKAVLAGQQPDGWFGPMSNKETPDLWPNMIMLYALRTQYEATGNYEILAFMLRYYRWQQQVPLDRLYPGSWQKWRGGDSLDMLHWLYNRTGESWLLDAAAVNHQRTADWTGTIPTWHGVNLCQGFREPGQYYQQSADPRHLAAAKRNYDTFMELYGQVPGGMFGADENCRAGYTGPRQAAEACSMVEMMHSQELLLAITGDITFADRCEDVAFNSLPAAMTPDLKALHYLTAPNMIQLDRAAKRPLLQNAGDMLSYSPYEQYRCCQHNIAFGWPYYAERLWMATPGNGLAAALYAASEVTATVGDGAKVTIVEKTEYPFDDRVELTLRAAKPVRFPLLLRVPGWCEGATVAVNGRPVEVDARPSAWIELDRAWGDGDTVVLTLPMTTRAKVWKTNRDGISIHRGPLAYSLMIGERWQRYGEADKWDCYEVFPTTPWNYGLTLDPERAAEAIEVVRREGPLADQPFTPDPAPIALQVKARRIPEWTQEPNGLIGEIRRGPVRTAEPEETVTLIPMGCARLRVSMFPRAGTGPEAVEWGVDDVSVSASHVGLGDSLDAINDGVDPGTARGQGVRRFTWYDHAGTSEWVEYTFRTPRRIALSEVFWFDDWYEAGCRVPESWVLLYDDGGTLKEMPNPSGYGRQRHRPNRATFDPVETTRVRLVAKLQPEASGGILEWRVGD